MKIFTGFLIFHSFTFALRLTHHFFAYFLHFNFRFEFRGFPLISFFQLAVRFAMRDGILSEFFDRHVVLNENWLEAVLEFLNGQNAGPNGVRNLKFYKNPAQSCPFKKYFLRFIGYLYSILSMRAQCSSEIGRRIRDANLTIVR